MRNRSALLVLAVCVCILVKSTASTRFHLEKQNKVSWFQAHVDCVRRNFKGLAVASSADKEREIIEFIEREAPGETYVWIGLTSLGQHAKYVWFPTGQQAEYTNWAPHARKLEDCIAMVKDRGQWKWKDDICHEAKAKYICED